MAGFKVMLADDQESDLKKYIYELTLESLKQARKDLSMDRSLLNKKEMAEWLSISPITLESMIRQGMPIHVMGERTFFLDKQEVRQWIMSQNK